MKKAVLIEKRMQVEEPEKEDLLSYAMPDFKEVEFNSIKRDKNSLSPL